MTEGSNLGGEDSSGYQQAAREAEEGNKPEASQRVAACLLKEESLGFGLMTPEECPVQGCVATFSKIELTVISRDSCKNPDYRPTSR